MGALDKMKRYGHKWRRGVALDRIGGRHASPWRLTVAVAFLRSRRCGGRLLSGLGDMLDIGFRRLCGGWRRSGPAVALALVVGVLAPLAGCAGSSAPPVTGKAAAKTVPYRIGPGDDLGIFVYGAPSLSIKSVPVRPDGRFSAPLLPNVEAAGKTTTELDKELTKRLSKYVKAPIVTVMVNSFHGAMGTKIHVLSGTSPPKAVPYVDHMTLLDVMTDVGGLPRFGAPNDAYVIRHEKNGKEKKIPVRIGALLNRGDLSQNIAMYPGDVVVIPQSLF